MAEGRDRQLHILKEVDNTGDLDVLEFEDSCNDHIAGLKGPVVRIKKLRIDIHRLGPQERWLRGCHRSGS